MRTKGLYLKQTEKRRNLQDNTLDDLLLSFGNVLLKKLGPRKANDISQRLRQLACLLMTLNSRRSDRHQFDLFLNGYNFDGLIKELCGLYVSCYGRRGFNTPSLALRLGHRLGKLANVKRGLCLHNQDRKGKEAAETFLSLHKSKWTDAISSNALNTLKRRKDQQISYLPLTEDLLNIRMYQMEEIKLLTHLQATPHGGNCVGF